MSLAPSFLMIATCNFRNGTTISFWNDQWDLGVIKSRFPQLFSFARKKVCSVKQFLTWEDNRSFFLPLSQIAFAQLNQLKNEIATLQSNLVGEDEWSYSWGSSSYFYHKAYEVLQGSHLAPPLFKWQWNYRAQNKHKYYFGFFFKIGLIPEICYTGSTWSWSPIFVFFVWRARRRIISIFYFHALSVMLAAHT
jgi:hypothetical protein